MAAGHHRPREGAIGSERSEWVALPPRAAGTALPAQRTTTTATSAEGGGPWGNHGFTHVQSPVTSRRWKTAKATASGTATKIAQTQKLRTIGGQ